MLRWRHKLSHNHIKNNIPYNKIIQKEDVTNLYMFTLNNRVTKYITQRTFKIKRRKSQS